MSDTDPYYAGPTVIDAKPQATPEEAPEAPVVTVEESYMDEVPEGSIKTVLAWVGDDKDRAAAALDAEKDGQQRSTLTKELEEILAS